MPVIIIHGVPASLLIFGHKNFKAKIKEAVAGVEELGITAEQVSVFIPTEEGQRHINDVVAIVEGLLEKPERTEAVKQKLGEAIVNEIYLEHNPKLAECIIHSVSLRNSVSVYRKK